MSKLPEALRLADALERRHPVTQQFLDFSAAAELRRQHALIAELLEALEATIGPLGAYASYGWHDRDGVRVNALSAITKARGAE